MHDWAEKYRPQHLEEVIGNDKAIGQLRRWAERWTTQKTPPKRAVILSGKAGIGKTSSALALANDFHWTPIELNASDARNAATIKAIATSGSLNETFDANGMFHTSKKGGRKLIILDEADNLYERTDQATNEANMSDRGGKKAIIDTIKHSNQPIVLIVNDYYNLIKGGGEPLKYLCEQIRYYPIYPNLITEYLKMICREEHLTVEYKLLQTIADRCNGDIRSAVNDLQSISFNKTEIDLTALDVLGYRDRQKIIFDGLREIFKTTNIQSLRESIRNLDESPDMLLLWITENLPREYIALDDLTQAYQALSKADMFLGRVTERQHYGFWSYATDLMTSGVAQAKSHEYGNDTYKFPTWLRIMKQTRNTRVLTDTLNKKIGSLAHTSKNKIQQQCIHQFKKIFQNDIEFACAMKNKLDLSEDEVLKLLGSSHKHKLKEIMKPSPKTADTQTDLKHTKITCSEKKQDAEAQQPSIFDF